MMNKQRGEVTSGIDRMPERPGAARPGAEGQRGTAIAPTLRSALSSTRGKR